MRRSIPADFTAGFPQMERPDEAFAASTAEFGR